MAPPANVRSRAHSLLLIQRLFGLRDGATPLTLVLDSLEQPSRPVVDEFIARAKLSRAKVLFVSFASVRPPRNIDVFVRAAGRDPFAVRRELVDQYTPSRLDDGKDVPTQKAVVVIDSLNSLASYAHASLPTFLSSIITPAVSVVAVYHVDVPVTLPKSVNEYEPHPFAVLCHLATAILSLSNLQHEIERQKARDRSLAEPEWGLKEGREGVLVGLHSLGSAKEDCGGVVIDMELRRRSGRTVSDRFILLPAAGLSVESRASPALGRLSLLSDHAAFAALDLAHHADEEVTEQPGSTFDLGLTEKQRKDREGVVLPYFDAQTDVGAGEGGRILYEMGREDDFDDEEDEV